ncbi:MAG: mechanosensitive ion channel family protein [Anaerolineae bacterium]|nr:mechanosensitive ion channel family protein [Anaerolineae bacterium]
MDTTEVGFDINQILTLEFALDFLRALGILIIGFLLAKFAGLALRRLVQGRASPHQAMLIQRGVYYLLLSVFVVTALIQLGFNLGVLLGAAGVLTIAIGFAAQTSMSNLISGLFLIGEQPFEVGDLIKVGETVGEVLSVDLLSIKLRKFDNTYVRIPNETLLNSEVDTLTKFPIRRIDLQIGIAYKEDVAKVRQVLLEIADKNPLCLAEPEPLIIFQGFGESSIDLQCSVWVRRDEYLTLKNEIQMDIKEAFDQQNIEIPFPHRTLYAGSVTDPLPVNIVSKL